MKRFLFVSQGLLFIVFNFSLLLTGYQLAGPASSTVRFGYTAPSYNHIEEYDASLQRLNSVAALSFYCDSIYAERAKANTVTKYEETFTEIASSAVRKRFYHGYSMYGFNDNFIATTFSSLLNTSGLSAIVIPNDILKFPYAACSQQSIVLMELLKKKGFTTRKIGFKGKTYGHFCFEVYYNGGWHFYDPDMEPNTAVLNAYNHPDIKFLAEHKDVLLKAYAQYPEYKVLDIFPNYFYGATNKFPAPAAMLFHKVSKVLSYTIWILFLGAFVLARRKYKKLSLARARAKNLDLPRLERYPGSSLLQDMHDLRALRV